MMMISPRQYLFVLLRRLLGYIIIIIAIGTSFWLLDFLRGLI